MRNALRTMEHEYRAKNLAELDKIWIRDDADEKAKRWLEMLIYEYFLSPMARQTATAVIVEVDDWGRGIEKASRDLEVYCQTIKMLTTRPVNDEL